MLIKAALLLTVLQKQQGKQNLSKTNVPNAKITNKDGTVDEVVTLVETVTVVSRGKLKLIKAELLKI